MLELMHLALCALLGADGARFGAFRAQIDGLEEPTAAAVDEHGRIWITESVASRVSSFDAAGAKLFQFTVGAIAPEAGAAALPRHDPRGIALAADEVFVSDAYDHDVKVYTREGRALRALGGRGAGAGQFLEPRGIAVAGERLYVADASNHRVQVLDLQGRALRSIGAFGRGDGEFNHPVDVAVDADGALFVADIGNQRVVKLDVDGKFVRSFGGFGIRGGLFMAPSGVRCVGGEVYVADRDNHRVQVFDSGGKLVHDFGVHALRPHEGQGRLHYANALALDPRGAFAVVLEGFENRAQIFGPSEEAQTQPSSERNTAAHYAGGCDVASALLAVLEPSGPNASLFDLSAAEPIEITRFGRSGTRFGELADPSDIALDHLGERAYVADPGNARISVFDVRRERGQPLAFLPTLAKFTAALDLRALAPEGRSTWHIEPAALELDAQGALYLCDAANARVVVLDKALDLLRSFGDFGDGAGRLRLPSALALSRTSERVYVVDARGARVLVFDRDGATLGEFERAEPGAPGALVRPFGISSGPDGSVYVTDTGAHRVLAFTADGAFVAAFGAQGLGKLEFYKPEGITQDAGGRIYVIDRGNHRFQILSPEAEFLDMFGARLFTEAERVK